MLKLSSKSKDYSKTNHRGLVIFIAKKFSWAVDLYPAIDFEDLVQAGNIGLHKSIQRFDDSQGNQFSTYAAFYIKGHILSFIKNCGSQIRIPSHLYENNKVPSFFFDDIMDYRIEQDKDELSLLQCDLKYISDKFLTRHETRVVYLKSKGWNFREISQKLEVSYQTIQQTFHRAVAKIQKAVKHHPAKHKIASYNA